ncbi:MAG: hypothetical protein H0U95_04020 [Bacteroidetes bacterium]|nr:hypothetical protein [Bacteroidota bacterium]
MEDEKDKMNKVNEYPISYKSKDLKIYSSIEEAAEAEAKYISHQDPIDRIKETVQLILRVFPLNEKKPNTNKIYIDKE